MDTRQHGGGAGLPRATVRRPEGRRPEGRRPEGSRHRRARGGGPMSTKAAHPTSGGRECTAVPGPATVSGDITSLNPSDGLFLRAEHLNAIQNYERALSLAGGIGGGTGVVYGFEASLDSAVPLL